MGFKSTLFDVIFDIRTERTVRGCCVYASALAIYFFWNYTSRIAPGIDVVTPSTLYWSIVLVRREAPSLVI